MIIRVDKIGVGSDEDPVRPDTDVHGWQVIKEYLDSFDIEIIED